MIVQEPSDAVAPSQRTKHRAHTEDSLISLSMFGITAHCFRRPAEPSFEMEPPT